MKFFGSFFRKAIAFGKSGKRVSYLLVFGLILQSHSFFAQSYSCGKGKVLICHKGKNTLCISESALQAHLDHGDHLGSCTGSECNVTATGGEITCSNPNATLTSYSNISGVSYQWTGPNNFVSTLSSFTVDKPGVYIVSISGTNCSASDTAMVTQNTEPPAGVNITSSDMLTCKINSVRLYGHSTTLGVSYNWSGPKGFISTEQNPKTTSNGLYNLVVTNPVNNCTSIASITITPDTLSVLGAKASVSGIITCNNTTVTLTGTSNTNDVIYKWTGPDNFTSENKNPVVSVPGIYILRVTTPGNNCSEYCTIEVLQNKVAPKAVAASASDILNITPFTTLTGSSITPDVIFDWTGPGGFTSSSQSPKVNVAGMYSLKVTNTSNGCSTIASVDVN